MWRGLWRGEVRRIRCRWRAMEDRMMSGIAAKWRLKARWRRFRREERRKKGVRAIEAEEVQVQVIVEVEAEAEVIVEGAKVIDIIVGMIGIVIMIIEEVIIIGMIGIAIAIVIVIVIIKDINLAVFFVNSFL